MSAHLSNEIVERFHTQSLTGGDRGVIYSHILGCETCRRRVVTSQAETAALGKISDHFLPQEGEEPYHVDPATIEAFVDNTLDALDRSTAKLHLEDCAECSAEVADLRESLATMKAASQVERQIARRIASSPPFGLSVPLRIAAMVAMIVFAAIALVLVLRWRSTGPAQPSNGRDVTAGTQPTPLASPQVPGVAPSPNVVVSPPKLAENPPGEGPERQQRALVALKDGANEIRIDQSGKIIGLPSLPAESRQAMKEALTGESINRPDVLDELISTQVSERATAGNEERIILVYPAKSVIQENQPTLRWTASKTAEAYRIEIADDKFHQVAKSEDLPATSQNWTPSTPLKRGQIYTWTIRAVNKGGALSSLTSQAKFKVLAADRIRELNQVKASQSHLALGLFYAREGMIAEAEAEFGILMKQNADSTLSRKLLTQIRSWRKR
jgi:hypothetical protein